MNKVKALVAGILTLVLAFRFINLALLLCALLIRRHWPNAWFAGLITWVALFLSIALSMGLAGYVVIFALKRQRMPN